MPDNSFEHNMSRQMEDFQYPASAAVWQKLEANLQKRKKRRWAIIWFFSGLVLVGTGLYFMARPADPIKEIRLVSNNLKADISEKLPLNPKENRKDKSVIPVAKSLRKHGKTEQVIVKKENEFNQQEIIEKSTENMVIDSVIVKDVDSVSIPKSSDMPTETDSIAVAKILPEKKTGKRSISFGIRFEAGRSANGQSSLQKTYTNNLISSPTAGGPITFSNPYAQEPSFGWSIGAWVKIPIRHRLNLQTGLQYHNYRTSTPVGTQVQSPLLINNRVGDMRSYYQPGNAANYQNNYHILSVPVEIALQLNKGKKLPVSWVLGMEPGWMIGSNAVIQDTSGYLYNDKSMYNRFQFGLQTGISFRMFQKSKHALELGPVFRYMITPAFKNGSDYNGHLNFLGLRADWKIR